MIVLLLEDKVYSIESFPKKIYERFPATSILKVIKRNVEECLTKSKTVPLLTDGWAIVIDNKVSIEQALPFCRNKANLVVLWIDRKNKMDIELKLTNEKLDYKVLDNLNVSKENLIAYVCKELNLKDTDAKTLCNKCNNYLPYVIESVTVLKSLGKQITRKDILKFIDKRSRMNVHSLFLHFIGYKVMETSLVASYLYDFRYGFSYIKESLLNYLNDAIEIYLLMEQGFLGADNFKTYDFGKAMAFSEYSMKSLIIDVHSVVSLEILILTKIKIQKSSLYDLLNYLN